MNAKPYLVLSIEDDPGFAQLIREAFAELGQGDFAVLTRGDLALGLEALEREPVDLVLLDLNLPDSVGLRTYQQLHLAYPGTPVVICTGIADEAQALAAVQTGAQDYLVKGRLTPSELCRAARYALERHAAQRAYSLMVEGLPQGVAVCNLRQELLYANQALATLVGEPLPRLLGRPLDLPLLEEGTHEAELPRSGRPPLVLEYRASRIFWNREPAILLSLHDVTGHALRERQLDRDAMERSRQLHDTHADLNLALDGGALGPWEWDVDSGRFVFSERAARLLGYRQDELVPTIATFKNLVHHEDLPAAIAHVEAHLAGRSPHFQGDFRLRHKDGSWRWLQFHGRLVEAPAGAPRHIAGTIADVHARHLVEDGVQLLAQVVQQAPDAIFITDPQGFIEYANPAFETITGYSAAQVVGQNPRILKSGEVAPATYSELWRTLASGQSWQGRLVNRRHDGTCYQVEARLSPIRDSNGKTLHLLAIERDVSSLVEMQQQLSQAQKMEAVGRLAGGVAHDFNNLLTIVMGQAQLARLADRDAARREACLDEITRASTRAATLTRQLLAFARKQPVRLAPLDLNAEVRRIGGILPSILGEDVQLQLDLAPEPQTIQADAGQIEQALMNLAVNARDAMPKGGTLTIATRSGSPNGSGKPALAVPFVRLDVTDTGSGMPPEVVAHLFEPFFTTKARERGTGLGLAIVYGLVKQHGGDVAVTSEVGNGTTFSLYLPLHQGPVAAPLADSGRLPKPTHLHTILVVEDDDNLSAMLGTVLREVGYEVLLADRASAALELAADPQRQLDLVLSDIVMPGMRGPQLVQQLVAGRPTLKALFMTGYAESVSADCGTAGCRHEVLQKPFPPKTLLAAIERLLAR